VLDPKSFSLRTHAETLVDTYFRGLAATSINSGKPRQPRLQLVHSNRNR
jgi:hypothetical protein